jgi:hypothetical protein
MAQHLLPPMPPVTTLPISRDGAPSPVAQWYPGIIYYIAERLPGLVQCTTTQAPIEVKIGGGTKQQRLVVPAGAAQFTIKYVSDHITRASPSPRQRKNGREGSLENVNLEKIRQLIKSMIGGFGAKLKLTDWHAVRRELTGKGLWANPGRGGRTGGEKDQVFLELVPGTFERCCDSVKHHVSRCRDAPGAFNRRGELMLEEVLRDETLGVHAEMLPPPPLAAQPLPVVVEATINHDPEIMPLGPVDGMEQEELLSDCPVPTEDEMDALPLLLEAPDLPAPTGCTGPEEQAQHGGSVRGGGAGLGSAIHIPAAGGRVPAVEFPTIERCSSRELAESRRRHSVGSGGDDGDDGDDDGELMRTRTDRSDAPDDGDDDHLMLKDVTWVAAEDVDGVELERVSSKLCELDLTSFTEGGAPAAAAATAAAAEWPSSAPSLGFPTLLQQQAPDHSSERWPYGLSMEG